MYQFDKSLISLDQELNSQSLTCEVHSLQIWPPCQSLLEVTYDLDTTSSVGNMYITLTATSVRKVQQQSAGSIFALVNAKIVSSDILGASLSNEHCELCLVIYSILCGVLCGGAVRVSDIFLKSDS